MLDSLEKSLGKGSDGDLLGCPSGKMKRVSVLEQSVTCV